MVNHAPGSASTETPATPPETIEDEPLTVDVASELMGRFGFIAFRTLPIASVPDFCLMAILRDVPTLEHFDPELVTYWVFRNGHGCLDTIDRAASAPFSRPFSWGRIRLVDRLGKRNSFVSFGGQMTATPVGNDALLVIFRSSAPILRLPGHSQFGDRLAEDVLAFFGRMLPRLWDPEVERQVGTASPDSVYAAFLLHEAARTTRAESDATAGDRSWIHRAVALLAATRPGALEAGGRLLQALGLSVAPATERGQHRVVEPPAV